MKRQFRLLGIGLAGIIVLCLVFFEGVYILSDRHAPQNMMPVHKGPTKGVGVFLINLDRSQDRLQYVMPSIQALHLPFERISAVDGKSLPNDEITSLMDESSYKNFMGVAPARGTIGCSLSHIKVWQTFLASPLEYALILEDDVSFDASLLTEIISDLVRHPHLWDVVNLENYHRGAPRDILALPKGHRLVSFSTQITRTGGYLLNRQGAQKLLAKALPIKIPVDHYFSRFWELDIKFRGVLPNIVQQTYGTSEIVGTKRTSDVQPQWWDRVLSGLKRATFRVKSDVIRFVKTWTEWGS